MCQSLLSFVQISDEVITDYSVVAVIHGDVSMTICDSLQEKMYVNLMKWSNAVSLSPFSRSFLPSESSRLWMSEP